MKDLEIPQVVAIDVETTGLSSARGDKICEVALLKIRDFKVIEKLCTLVNPGRQISYSAACVNGITDDMVADAPAFCDIAKDISDFLHSEILLIHNASFDLSFLKRELAICDCELRNREIVDTLKIARRFFSFQNNSLPALALYFGMGTEGLHRAEYDAWTAYRIFLEFVPLLREQNIYSDSLEIIK